MYMRVCPNGMEQVGIRSTLVYQFILQQIENQRMGVKSRSQWMDGHGLEKNAHADQSV